MPVDRNMTTDPDVYFARGCGRCDRFDTPDCSTKIWAEGLAGLRALCLSEGLEETAKWGHPCYMHAGRNIALINAFRGEFNLTMMNAALLSDVDAVLEKAGPNASTPSIARFTTLEALAAAEPILRRMIGELKDHAEKGTKSPKVEREVPIPDELIDALDADPELAEAFHALTPGRQKSYAFNLNQAKQSATRVARIEKFREKILAGKGAMER